MNQTEITNRLLIAKIIPHIKKKKYLELQATNEHTYEQIIPFLMGIIGKTKETKVYSFTIEEALGLSGRQVRSIVNYLRSIPIPVCSNSGGYWFAHDTTDLEDTITQLNNRIYPLLQIKKKFRFMLRHWDQYTLKV